MKICKDCKITKPLNEFQVSGKSKVTGKIWYIGRCRKCHNLKFRPRTGIISSTRFKKGNVPWNKQVENGKQSLICNEWKLKVLERDKYTCQKCCATENLHVHHIKSWNDYPALRLDLDNGIVLCHSCHGKIHSNEDKNFKKGQKPWCTGKKFSTEYRKKLSDAHKGVSLSEKHKEALRGRVPWNKGLTGIMKGRVSPMKDKKQSEKTKEKISESLKKHYALKRQKKLEGQLSIEGS